MQHNPIQSPRLEILPNNALHNILRLMSGLLIFGLLCGVTITPNGAVAETSTQDNPLNYHEYKVLFTNPDCQIYPYKDPVPSADGSELLTHKPEDSFCTATDLTRSLAQDGSPEVELLKLIESETTEELFLSYFSFSNPRVAKALCSAIQRGVKISFVLDKNSGKNLLNQLTDCQSPDSDLVTIKLNGHTGGIGFAHNKLILVNPNLDNMTIIFGSGNLSEGTVLHHENWHFITLSTHTYFAQEHLCLMQAQLSKEASGSRGRYADFLKTCRGHISYAPESDIRAYFTPAADDRKQVLARLTEKVEHAGHIDIAAHRFSLKPFIQSLKQTLSEPDRRVRMVADDDLYWSSRYNFGNNTMYEYNIIDTLISEGLRIQYVQTNHSARLLHHNKFIIFSGMNEGRTGVFTGAGNFTNAAFERNFENFYYIEIPEVVKIMSQQFEHLWQNLSTPPEKMPSSSRLPQMTEAG